jgi:peptide/nickel transport system substrate-binding protein
VKNFITDFITRRYSVRPLEDKSHTLWGAFSFGEKWIVAILIILFVGSGIGLLFKVSNAFLIEVPEYGGTITEGIVGVPRFINPLLAISDADKDLTYLTYSGLLKATPEGGLTTDLAKEWHISENGLTYTFILKDNIFFHDGTPITTDDIEFTIQKAIDPLLKSPRRSNWEGVTVNKISPTEISFSLKQPYSPFTENLTLGILPKHIWKNASSDEFAFSEYNISPIGSGPYKIQDVKRNSAGLPTSFTLTSFADYSLGKPFVKEISIKIFQNEQEVVQAWENETVESISGISAEKIAELNTEYFTLYNASLPRIFGVFFNQNQAQVFLHKEVREALELATHKEEIVRSTLLGYGTVIDSPLPYFITSKTPEITTSTSSIEKALALLDKNGWKKNAEGIMQKKNEVLSFSLSTGDAPELKKTAGLLQNMWKEIGVSLEIKVFESGDLNQNIIRPRKFDSLLFGMVVGRDADLFPFWHSSQRNDPGLNIALYTNITTDKILENIRITSSEDKKKELYKNFEIEIAKDTPAIFLYSPDFMYILPEHIQNVELGHVQNPSERFLNVHSWFIETNKVWKIFTSQEQ